MDSNRHRWLGFAGAAVSVLALVAVVIWAIGQPTPDLPDSASEIASLAAAIGVLAINTGLRGERAYRLLGASGAGPARSDAYGLTVVGYMGNTILPARGGDALRVYLQAPRAKTTMRNVVGTLIAERLLDAATLLTIFAVLAYGVLRGIAAPDGTGLAVAALIAAGMALIAGAVLYLVRHHAAARRAITFLEPMTVATRNLRGSHGARMLVMTLGIWTLEAGVYMLAGKAVDLDLGLLDSLYIVALASVFVLVPAGPGYAGTLDAAILFGAGAVGASGAEALSYLLTVRFVLLVPLTVAGGVLLIARYGGLQSLRNRRRVTA